MIINLDLILHLPNIIDTLMNIFHFNNLLLVNPHNHLEVVLDQCYLVFMYSSQPILALMEFFLKIFQVKAR